MKYTADERAMQDAADAAMLARIDATMRRSRFQAKRVWPAALVAAVIAFLCWTAWEAYGKAVADLAMYHEFMEDKS